MKKIFLLMFAAAAALGSWAQSTAAVSATATSDKLSVALTNESEAFVAFQMDIVLPEGVTVANDGNAVTLNDQRLTAAAFSGTAIAGAENANFVIAYNVIESSKVRVIAYNLENRALAGTEGELFTVAFTGTATGDFTVQNVKFVTKDALAEVDLEAVQSQLGSDKLLGDINMDGTVDGDDVAAAVSIYLNNVAIPVDREAGDLNADGKVDGDDIALILSIYLGH